MSDIGSNQAVIEGPKSFLTPRDLAAAIGVSESSLKRWADEGLLRASRTAGGHRRISLAEAVRFIRESRVPVLRPEVLGFRDAALSTSLQGGTDDDELFGAFVRDDQRAARSLILSAYLAGRPIAELCDGAIRLAFEKLGDLWRHDASGIVLEHRAVDTAVQTLNLIRSTIPPAPPLAPVALGGAAPGDPHILPSLVAAMVLAEAGYHEVNLGPDVPTVALERAVERYRPVLVWRSIGIPVEVESTRRDLAALAQRLSLSDAFLVVGGRGSRAVADTPLDGGRLLGSMTELSSFARELLPDHPGP